MQDYPSCVDENLYLGGSRDAKNFDILKELGVTHVVKIDPIQQYPDFYDEFKYFYIPIFDQSSNHIKEYFESSFEFIDEGLKTGAVLVHCGAGVSRSATIVIAYMMRKYKIGYESRFNTALEIVRSKRSVIEPNEGFERQLKEFEIEILTKNDGFTNDGLVKSEIEIPIEVWRIILNHLGYHAIRLATVSKIFYHQIVFQCITDITPLFSQCRMKFIKLDMITDDFIKQFPNIEKLDIEDYHYNHSITEVGLNSLKSLTYFKIEGRKLFFERLEGLSNLKRLFLCDNEMKNESIKILTSLTELNIEKCPMIADEAIEELYNLTTLSCGYTLITDRGISKLTNITSLILSDDTPVTNDGLKCLLKLSHLDLYGNNSITDDGLKYLTNITDLKVGFNNIITNEGIKHLTNITSLELYNNKNITDDGIRFLSNSLTELDLYNNKVISDNGIKEFSNLRILDLGNNGSITDEGIKDLTNLTSLRMNSPHFMCQITDFGLKNLCNITSLLLTHNDLITDEVLSIFTALTELSLYCNGRITNNGVKGLLSLRIIDIGFNNNITDDAVSLLTNLTDLDLYGNTLITNDGIKGLTKLKILNLGYNTTISNDGVRGLTNITSLSMAAFDQVITLDGVRNYLSHLQIQ